MVPPPLVMSCALCCNVDDKKEELLFGDLPENAVFTARGNFKVEEREAPVQQEPVQQEPVYVQPTYPTTEPDKPARQAPEPVKPAYQTLEPVKTRAVEGKKRVVSINLTKKSRQVLGLDVDYSDDVTLKILKINSGLVQKYNKYATYFKFRAGQRIIAVNGVSGDPAKLTQEVRGSNDLVLSVLCEAELEIRIEKPKADSPVGVDIDLEKLIVVKVQESGPVRAYNDGLDEYSQEYAVQPGDQIILANGKWTREDVIQAVKSEQTIDLILLRATPRNSAIIGR